jgi:hypothetical protein
MPACNDSKKPEAGEESVISGDEAFKLYDTFDSP